MNRRWRTTTAQIKNKQPVRTDKWPLDQYDCRQSFHSDIYFTSYGNQNISTPTAKKKIMNRKYIWSKSHRRGQCCRFYTEGILAQSVLHICLNPGTGQASEISNRHSKVSIIRGLWGGQGALNALSETMEHVANTIFMEENKGFLIVKSLAWRVLFKRGQATEVSFIRHRMHNMLISSEQFALILSWQCSSRITH